ncbi:hypothetical protein GTQ99_00310 [Kineococcus sp. T13]|uniref:hypothetical protein n=1 Tax=Kineococcus vitellinus TaxID=2696565 RepID=UPI001411CBF4|nr:hypothetical protein [Kineococcus vitellinus]NAZ73873.1 hypothetical protein [Kineococcus vitellinus]
MDSESEDWAAYLADWEVEDLEVVLRFLVFAYDRNIVQMQEADTSSSMYQLLFDRRIHYRILLSSCRAGIRAKRGLNLRDPVSPAVKEVLQVDLFDMAAGAVVGRYVEKLLEQVEGVILRPHKNMEAPNPLAVREAARWAVNRVYSDVLPAGLTPISEAMDLSHWFVTYEYDGYRYSVWKDLTKDDGQASVQRTVAP